MAKSRSFRFRITASGLRWGLAGIVLFSLTMEPGTESFTLVTTYPAPSGVYNKMITTGDTYLARDNATNNSKVGVGTTDPQALLEVNGNVIAKDPTAGNHLATKDYVDASGGGKTPRMAYFSANGNWKWPGSAVSMVWVTVCGGGGGGGGSFYGGGGGGGAGYSYIHYPFQVNGDVAVTVGGGGSAGSAYGGNGGNGLPSSFGSLTTPGGNGGGGSYGNYYGGNGGSGSEGGGGGGCYCNSTPKTCYSDFTPGIGGNGAQSGTAAAGGSAGVPNGGLGGPYAGNSWALGGGGAGGGGPLGIGGNGGSGSNGADGTGNCSGGGGGGTGTNWSPRPGGAGAPGMVIVEWWQ